MNYYNENDPSAAAWLRELIAEGLIPAGHVDERSILDVRPSDLAGFRQCHFFAGIGGWSLALQLAGWPEDRPVWTGSCPCQPFSVAGKGLGERDERHLWPVFRDIIAVCRPPVVFGEQVEAAVRHGWLDGVFADLEGEGYSCGAVVLGAHSVRAPHIRQRLWWVADSSECSRSGRLADSRHESARGCPGPGEEEGGRALGKPSGCSPVRGMGHADGAGPFEGRQAAAPDGHGSPAIADGCPGRLGDSKRSGLPRESLSMLGSVDQGFWDVFDLLPCLDGKSRRVEPGSFPLAHGLPGRVGLLRGYGNAIVPEVAAEFIKAYLEI